MPVAAVDKHRDAGASEQQGCRSTQVALRSRVDPVPEPYGVHQAAQRQLRLRVPASLPCMVFRAAALKAHGVYMVRGYAHCVPADRVADEQVAEPLTWWLTAPPSPPDPARD